MALNKYYKMVGWYVEGGVHESFVVMGAPAQANTVNPNTLHPLINTYVASFWEI